MTTPTSHPARRCGETPYMKEAPRRQQRFALLFQRTLKTAENCGF
jgi:hypothetical protein